MAQTGSVVQYDAEQKVWKGPIKEYPFEKTLGVAEAIYNFLRSNPEHICQISDDSGEVYTAERMLKAGISFAQELKSRGIGKGDNVLVLMDSHHYMMPSWLGTIFTGAVICPFAMTDNSVIEEISDIVNQVQPKIFVTSREDLVNDFKRIFTELKLDCPIFLYENKIPGCHDLKPLLEHEVSVDDFIVPKIEDARYDVLLLVLSSATTGKPKLINSTHMHILASYTENYGKLTVASTNKPGWSLENSILFGGLLQPATRIINAKDITIDEFLQMLERYKVNMITIKPKDIFAAIRSKAIKNVDLSNIRMVVSTGQHLSEKIANEFKSYIKNAILTNFYGTSDIGIAITSVIFGKSKPGSVGQINANMAIKVVNEAGEKVGPMDLGEIYVKSPCPFGGYYKNEKMTQEALDKDGYYATGDIGYVEEDGTVYLVDRKKFLISYKGEFLNQSEIEKIVMDHVKGVEAVCVVDIEHEEYNVVPIICIIPEKGAKLNDQDIIETVYKYYKRTFYTRVFFVDDLPLTISGKCKKYLVREQIMKKLEKKNSAA